MAFVKKTGRKTSVGDNLDQLPIHHTFLESRLPRLINAVEQLQQVKQNTETSRS
jgi:hypothetical protein